MGYKESLPAVLKNCAQKTAKDRYCEISHIIFENTAARLAQRAQNVNLPFFHPDYTVGPGIAPGPPST